MSKLVIVFEGMSLIVSDQNRSEAFFIATNKVTTEHRHDHVVKIGNSNVPVNDALMWVEQNGTRLQGKVDVQGQFLTLLDDIAPGDPLAPPLTTADPDANRAWLDRLAVWFRLPGGVLDTAPTPTTGGNLQWNFPAYKGQPANARRLTQTGILTRQNVTGPIRLATKTIKPDRDQIDYQVVPPDANGDFKINVMTNFVGTPPTMPIPNSIVQLEEMQLVYACLQSGSGPIPSATWPSNPQPGAPTLSTSDPATGICPLAFKKL
jgi:hypothetical protein